MRYGSNVLKSCGAALRDWPGREIFISRSLCVDTITILYFVYATEPMEVRRN